jgi:sialic acid synthase SpsE
MANPVSLNGCLVGDGQPVYIIAEGGLTNWGQLALAKQQADTAKVAGCDAVKFQAQTTEALVSRHASPEWYDRLKYKELPFAKLTELTRYCASIGIQSFITAHTDVDLDFLDRELDVPFFKVGSGESLNFKFLENVGSRAKPVIISLGLHITDEEIRASIAALESGGCRQIVVLHCNTVYPTPPAMNDLSKIAKLKRMLDYPVGYSDHTVGWHIPLAAVALGAAVIEKHLSFDLADIRSLDSAGSCTPEMLVTMVAQMRDVEAALVDSEGLRTAQILKAREWARQSIVAAKKIQKGTTITRDLIALKRPGTGMGPERLNEVVGAVAGKDIDEDELILDVNIER